MCGFYKIFLRTGKLRPLKVFYNQEITREDCVQFRTGGASREDCVRSQPVQSITGGLCAVSATAEHHGRTVCGLSQCRASREDCVRSQSVQITREDCVRSQPVQITREDCVPSQSLQSITGGLCAVSDPAAPGQQVRQDVRRPPVSCQPVSDFATFGLIQTASRQKSKKSA